ncbi:MAG: amidohydrolase family protein [Actinomycetota bacterium]
MTETLQLTGGTLVTSLWPADVVQSDVVVKEGRIFDLGSSSDEETVRIDCSGCLIIPGNVCAHHHLYSSLARGMPYSLETPENFLQILQRVWWRLDRALDGDGVWWSAWVGGVDALLAGTTTVIDHHASPNAIEGSLDQVAASLGGLGVRAVLCYEVTDRDGPEAAQAGIEENRRFLTGSSFHLARGMVGAHASFTMSEETLAASVDLARSMGAGIHIHVAEDAADERDAEARFGRRVVTRLAEAGALDERALLAHCIHLDETELEALRGSRATAVHNPRSNMNNRVGHAPVGAFGRLALGTDGVGGDMFAESKAAFWRAREADPGISPEWVLERMAESARFAGVAFGEPLLGRIEPGAPADVDVLEYDPPSPLTGENLAGHWVFGLSSRHVRDVLVAGRPVVRDREPTYADRAHMTGRAREFAERLWARMEEIGPHPFEPAGSV